MAVKVGWRQQEIVLISTISFFTLARYIAPAFTLTPEEINDRFRWVYEQHQVPFNYYYSVFLPKVGSLLLLYGMYMAVNFVVLPVQKIYESRSLSKIIYRILLGIAIITGVCVMAALAVNLANDFAQPWLFSYGPEFNLLAFFGYQPNLFKAFIHAFLLMGLYTVYAFVRDAITWHLQKPANKNPYSLLVANQVSAILFSYILLAWILKTSDSFQNINIVTELFSIITPVLLLSLSNIYWLFPGMKRGFYERRTIIRLLISGFFSAIPFLLFPVSDKKWLIFLFFWIGLTAIVTPVSWLFFRLRKDKILQLRAVQQALARSETDLQFLKSQINPHFLFNTLNTLYGLSLQEGGMKTAEGIQRLGDMMRFMLHENNRSLIPVERELAYMDNYITLQKLRIQPSLAVSITSNTDVKNCDRSIAPMLLIPFVENAFKYGISLAEPSWIDIDLVCKNDRLHFKVVNSVHANQPELKQESSGIGIANVAERLKFIYPGKHLLVHKQEANQFIVELTIQF